MELMDLFAQLPITADQLQLLLGLHSVLALHVVRVVFRYIALYDLYLSCDPDNAVLYLV